MLIVIIILGITALAVLPNVQALLRDTRLTEAAAELVSSLQYARNLAARYGRPFGFQADAAGRWFKVYDNRYAADTAAHADADPPVTAYGVVLNPLDKKWYQIDFDDLAQYSGVAFSSAQIVFYPDGHCNDPAAANPSMTVSLGAAQRTVTVDGVTGRVSAQ